MTSLTEETFEKTLSSFIRSDAIDLRDVSFIDPYGMVGLLEIGELCMLEDVKKTVLLPRSVEVLRYLERMDFFPHAKRYFILEPIHAPSPEGRAPDSDVLLEITPVERANDIHSIVGKVEERAQAILAKHLRYDGKAINSFIVALSEICQNIIEHSENKGFVGIQKYRYPGLGRNIVKIAVMDAGIGFRKSLSSRFKLRNDLDAIEKALLHGASRHADEGRGHGLAAVRRFIGHWQGRLSIRSGSARLSIIPPWSRGREQERNLTPFPGSQINIILPEVQTTVQPN
ncbi:MAG TPA: ATP-binding protein [Nitrospirota bacterium]|nr:ATP-binding protein [Nitrospirota bacterium]